MQKGFATLEIIFITLIIAVLVAAAIPNAARVIDRAALDYEQKRLYSELRFLRAMNRTATINTTGTGKDWKNQPPFMQIYTDKRSYQILRGTNAPLRELHQMRNIKSLSYTAEILNNQITFISTGQATNMNYSSLDTTITLTSRLGKQAKIIFDSVGRIRGG